MQGISPGRERPARRKTDRRKTPPAAYGWQPRAGGFWSWLREGLGVEGGRTSHINSGVPFGGGQGAHAGHAGHDVAVQQLRGGPAVLQPGKLGPRRVQVSRAQHGPELALRRGLGVALQRVQHGAAGGGEGAFQGGVGRPVDD